MIIWIVLFFAKDTQHAIWPIFEGNKWIETLGVHVCIVLSIYMLFIFALVKLFILIWDIAYQPYSLVMAYLKA